MRRAIHHLPIVFAIACCLQGIALAQSQPPAKIRVPVSPALPDASATLPPMKDPATVDQIREYHRLSGEVDSFRASWIAAVDKNRSFGAQYWPESFWTDLKAKMGKTDLVPMYITLFQHGISRGLMQEVLNTYPIVGATLFKISPVSYSPSPGRR